MIVERLLVALMLVSIVGCAREERDRVRSDSSFAVLQLRGETAMGVNQYTSQHVFETLPDGGRIVLQRSESDFLGKAAIRAHMRTISKAFSDGDFALPGFVHDTADVPGTAVRMDHRAGMH